MTYLKFVVKYTVVLLIFTLANKTMAFTQYDKPSIQQLIVNEAIQQNVNPALALAIAKVESDFNPNALSHVGAKGVMQIMPDTAEKEFGVSRHRLYDAPTNIRLGIRFIKQLLSAYGQRVDIALSHYNGGSAVKDKLGNLSVIPATEQYVKKVLINQNQFNHLAQRLLNSQTVMKSGIGNRQKNGNNPMLISQLHQLRMHNILRGMKQPMQELAPAIVLKSIKNPMQELVPAIVLKSIKNPLKNSLKSIKKQKVLEWESIFN